MYQDFIQSLGIPPTETQEALAHLKLRMLQKCLHLHGGVRHRIAEIPSSVRSSSSALLKLNIYEGLGSGMKGVPPPKP